MQKWWLQAALKSPEEDGKEIEKATANLAAANEISITEAAILWKKWSKKNLHKRFFSVAKMFSLFPLVTDLLLNAAHRSLQQDSTNGLSNVYLMHR